MRFPSGFAWEIHFDDPDHAVHRKALQTGARRCTEGGRNLRALKRKSSSRSEHYRF